jgi:small-conductance mechanosensitive channel
MANGTFNLTPNNFSLNVTPVDLRFMDKVWMGNSMREYIFALILFVASAALMKLISYLIIRILEHIDKKHPTQAKEIVVRILRALQLPLFIIIALKISTKFVDIPPVVEVILKYAMLIIITYYVVRAINAVIYHSSKKIIERREREDHDADRTLMTFLTNVLCGVIWIIGFLFVLDSFGVNVSKIVTGLGIAGIAVAFALQNVLGDIFASVSIYFDKPFKPGESIVFNGDEGEIIRTGIKSTRIKLLRGEELVVSNKYLTETKLQNLSRMEKRRVKQELNVVYGLAKKKLEKIPAMLEALVKKYKKEVEFGRCHLKSLKEYSVEFELIYYIKNNNYKQFMDIQQKITLDILELFEKENIQFAFPTRVVYIEKNEKFLFTQK